ncbi:alpha/beta fold hydrolase [Streptomyces sp. NPDC020747]|uniref:alpha/beta fold hydrolase n=1 Tax=Streptomyces sp. NPDC020747 TaxID=3365086 RepID=UPI0037B81B08
MSEPFGASVSGPLSGISARSSHIIIVATLSAVTSPGAPLPSPIQAAPRACQEPKPGQRRGRFRGPGSAACARRFGSARGSTSAPGRCAAWSWRAPPRGGRNIHLYTAAAIRDTAFGDAPTAEGLLTLFFEKSASSQAKGVDFLKRLGMRTAERDTPSTLAVRDAQLIAISAWGVRDDTRLQRLASIQQSVLVANGDNDEMVPTENTYLLAEHLPNAKLSIYPDAGHGFLFQYPVEFDTEVNAFLGS